jgi:N-acetylneuraminic acid mutarotase
MGTPRRDHTATLLSDGRVLVAGGSDDYHMVAATELYDPASRSWSIVGRMEVPRSGHTATLLPDGTVLVTGGYDDRSRILASTEIFDPDSGTWGSAGTLVAARTAHTATLLPDDRVIVAGGSAYGGHGEAMRAVELYDPANGTWTSTKRMLDARWGHTATLLPDGQVLVAGGFVGFGALASAELYDSTTESWAATGSMISARAKFTATLLSDGTVLAAGLGDRRSAEIFDPSKGRWTGTGRMTYSRGNYPTATLLPDGMVLMTGGTARDAQGDWLEAFAELYDPASKSWIGVGNPQTARFSHTATLLTDGTMLIVGGHGLDGALATAEIWDPRSER